MKILIALVVLSISSFSFASEIPWFDPWVLCKGQITFDRWGTSYDVVVNSMERTTYSKEREEVRTTYITLIFGDRLVTGQLDTSRVTYGNVSLINADKKSQFDGKVMLNYTNEPNVYLKGTFNDYGDVAMIDTVLTCEYLGEISLK
jgi:hypothetical protein